MANVKNFGLIGVGANVQFSKGGSRIINNAGTFNFRDAAGSGDVAVTTAGITSSAGNVTLTTGNLVMTSSAGTLSVGGDTTLSRHAAGIFKFDGTAAVVMPTGVTGEQPSAAATTGGMRYNSTLGVMEYSNGSVWSTLATGGAAVTAVSVASANGLAGSSSGGTTPTLTLSTTVTGILKGDGTAISAAVSGTDLKTVGGLTIIGSGDVGTIGPAYGGTGVTSYTAGDILYATGATTLAAAAPGATSGVQPYNAGLTALAAFNTNGIIVQTAEDTYSGRTLVAPAAGITITNADGVSGNPTFALANDLAALEGLTTTGYIVRTGDGTATTRSITGVAGRIVVSNGDGVSSNTDIDLATLTDAGTGSFVKITRDSYGRVEGTTAVVAGDITTLVDSVYVNASGDTMTGNLNMGTNYVTMDNAPTTATQAANKAYVDAQTNGLSWKQAVKAASTGNLTLSGEQTVDGVALVTGDRVLVKDQTDQTENGIYVVDSGAWTRGPNTDTGPELVGAAVLVTGGTVNDNSGWVQTTDPVTLGVSNIVWAQFTGSSTYTWGTGLGNSGNTVFVKLGAGIVELPSDEVGIDVVSNLALQLTGSAAGDQLTFVLDGGAGSGLEQSSAGLKISASGVTNAMLVNSNITFNADNNVPDQVALGETMLFAGSSVQGITTTVGANQITISAANASSSQKGVASFDATQFTVTAGNVVLGEIPLSALPGDGLLTITGDTGSDTVALGESLDFNGDGTLITTSVAANVVSFTLGTVDVAHGGTGATTLLDTAVLIGNGTGVVEATADLTFDSSNDTLAIGAADGVTIQANGGDVTITALDTNADINLVPNGSGAVVIGPSGAGLIQSDTNQNLTVQASGTGVLALTSGGDLVINLAASNAYKVAVAGPTAAQYADGLADTDLVNKYYVDSVAGNAAGNVEAVSATVTLTNATTNIGAAIPAGATVLSVKVNVTAADSGSGTLEVGKSGDTDAYMATSENDTQTTGLYLAETMVTEGSSTQIIATCAGATSGTAKVVVTYQLAE